MRDEQALKRFGLSNGQFFGVNRCKNLHWELNGKRIGFGDLTDGDITRISSRLASNEEFVGWNEHHGTENQQTNTPMIRITHDDIKFREDIVREEGR